MHQGYIKGLDGLRAVAILWVMFGHISSSLNWPVTSAIQKPFNLITNMGWVGVQLFFVISGFLITQILLKDQFKPGFLKNFYIRRSLRIFPVYYLALIIFFVLIPLLGFMPEWLANSKSDQLWYWLYLQNWIRPFSEQGALAPLWSLAIEEQYYLIWPLCVLFFRNSTLKLICVFMIVSAPIIRTFLFTQMPDFFNIENIGKSAAYNFTFARWDAIAIGSLIGIYVSEKKTDILIKISQVGTIAFTLIILAQIALFSNFTSVALGIGMLNQTTVALLFGCLILLISQSQSDQNIIIRCLEFSPIKSIGKVSYAMYLFHLPIVVVWLGYWNQSFQNYSWIETLITIFSHYFALVLIMYILARLSWALFEHPILKFKDKFN
ncbi:acyltransferase family protein [Pleionea sediminis]|uniref:acyltransferase family protein n=1 Tax=Pleionea sediminis TaxID=2569479 RepID=UPI0011862192|nr:acyltransferase [Pleionea sediminis]